MFIPSIRAVALVGMAVFAAGCGSVMHRHQRPDDFSLKYAKSSPAISTAMWWKYSVEIDAKGMKTMHWASNEGDKDSTVQLDAADYDALYATLRKDGAFDKLADNPPCPNPIGGGNEDLTLFAKGDYTIIPRCSTKPGRQKKIEQIWNDVRQVVGKPPR
jgi:hypothetical protein